MTTIKGDQTVKKNLYVDLTMQAEQVTSTDDMTMAGYFLNTMASDDTIGMYLDQNTNNYTGSSTNKSLSILKTISGSTGTSFSTFGIELGVTDDKDFTADTGSRVVYGQNIGLSVTGDRSSGVTDFIEDIIGLSASVIKSGTNQASGLATDNLSGINASATLSTTNNNAATNFYQTVYGVNAGATIENASMTGSSASLSVYGVSSSVVGLSSSGWDTKKLYGYYFSQFLMGMTATEKWAFYNSSSWNNHLGNDNSKTYWGTGEDASIYYDGTNMYINPKEVGTGALVVPSSLGLTGTRVTKGWFTDEESTNLPTVSGIKEHQVLQLTSDQNTSSQVLGDCTGLNTFSLAAGKTYHFKFRLMVQTNAATVGILCSVNNSTAVTSINYLHKYPTSATAFTMEQVTALQGGTLPTSGPGTTNTEYIIEGTVVANTAGTFALQFRSETATQTTIKAGSIGIVTAL
jgi:hypothetical protein